jgi:hypothetical protein
MKKHVTLCLLLLATVLISACSTSTKITGSWIDPAATTQTKSIKSVFIASLSRKIEFRTKLENALALEAQRRNVKAIKSSEFFTPEFYQKMPSKEELLSKIRQTGVQAILTVSLINKESETRYVPGTHNYSPYMTYGWYGSFYNYYNYWYPQFNDPGYYVTDKTYFLETNLYDVQTEKLIWSGQSETINPGSIDAFVKNYPKVLVEQMIKDGLITQ